MNCAQGHSRTHMLRHLTRSVSDACHTPCLASQAVSLLSLLDSQTASHGSTPHFHCSQQHLHTAPCVQAPAPAQTQNAPKPAWTPTCQLTKRKVLPKRMGYLLQVCFTLYCSLQKHCLAYTQLLTAQPYYVRLHAVVAVIGSRRGCSCGKDTAVPSIQSW